MAREIPDIIGMATTGRGAPKMDKGTPDPSRLISGKYETATWNHFSSADGKLFSGIWESSKGKVKVSYEEWEFCHIISGEVILRKEGSRKAWTFKKNDAFIIPAGFKGTWETVKKLRKHYVILMP